MRDAAREGPGCRAYALIRATRFRGSADYARASAVANPPYTSANNSCVDAARTERLVMRLLQT